MNATILGIALCLVCLFAPLPSHADESGIPNKDGPNGSATINPPSQSTLTTSGNVQHEFDWEFDPYYSALSLSIPLSNSPIAEVTEKSELAIYDTLLQNALYPRFMLLEAALFPMPLFGVASKKYTPELYRAFNVGDDLNLLEAVTAGFQEPYALSLFLGNMVSFVKPGEDKSSSNKGYMGYLFSYSNQHIKRNVLIPDHNLETELKLKGDRSFADDKLNWSFRIGAKLHDNPDISDTVYIGLRRSNLDFSADALSFFSNSSMNVRLDFSIKDGTPLRQEYTIGKKIPVSGWHVALTFDVGFIWENPANYKGRLRDTDHQDFVAVIRPNIAF